MTGPLTWWSWTTPRPSCLPPSSTGPDASGVRLVGIFDPAEGEGQGRSYLAGLGVEAVVPASMPVDEILDVVRSLHPPHPDSADMADLAARAASTAPPAVRSAR